MEDRQIRGYSIIAKGDTPKIIDKETFLVPSQSSNKKYKVVLRNEWVCECPDFRFNRAKCKHIYSVEFLLKLRQKLDDDSSLDIVEELTTISKCQFCNSESIVKNGLKKNKIENKQRYLCRDCKRTFYQDSQFNYIRNPKLISLVLDLYFKGLSLRKITDTVRQFFQIKLHHETVRRWIMKFSQMASEYTDKLQPKLGDTWHTDEQMVKVKGKWEWNWNVLDADTRFLIATNLTKSRYIKDARKVFQKSKKIAETNPDRIITDGLFSYEKAIKKEFIPFRTKTKHVRLASIRAKVQNNKVERFHNTFREFDKTRRGFKSEHTSQGISNGFRTYYNFIRPHMGISNHTPSQMAGIDLDLGSNRWLDLIRMSKLNESLEKQNKFKLNFSSHSISVREKYLLRVYDANGNELDCKELGFKKTYRSEELADRFIEFFKVLYPKLTFKIEENNETAN